MNAILFQIEETGELSHFISYSSPDRYTRLYIIIEMQRRTVLVAALAALLLFAAYVDAGSTSGQAPHFPPFLIFPFVTYLKCHPPSPFLSLISQKRNKEVRKIFPFASRLRVSPTCPLPPRFFISSPCYFLWLILLVILWPDSNWFSCLRFVSLFVPSESSLAFSFSKPLLLPL